MAPTFDIPFGSSKTSAKRTSPADFEVSYHSSVMIWLQLTLSHEIFEVMPFDVVSQIANIDTAVLLGWVAHRLHHLFFRLSTIFEWSCWLRTTSSAAVSWPWISSRCVWCTTHRTSGTTFTSTVIFAAAAGTTARRVWSSASARAAGAATRRAWSVSLWLIRCVSWSSWHVARKGTKSILML